MPLGLSLVVELKSGRSSKELASAMRAIINNAKSRNFDVSIIRTDGEGGWISMINELQALEIAVDVAGPGQHVARAVRKIRTIKERVRIHESVLPFIMTHLLVVYCVYFCVSRLNIQPSSTTVGAASPREQFVGRKINAKKDLRVSFGDYVQATTPTTDNSMKLRTDGCIVLLPTGNLQGSVKMWSLATKRSSPETNLKYCLFHSK